MKNRNLKNSDHWKTPDDLYDKLNDEFNFDFDPCPLHAEFDGLICEWGDRNFINPPYSQKLKEAFIKKASEEADKGKICVLLLPVSTSTKIFHEVILYRKRCGNAEIRFIKGRVKFEGINTFGEKVSNKCGMHDSMIVIFRPGRDIRYGFLFLSIPCKQCEQCLPSLHSTMG